MEKRLRKGGACWDDSSSFHPRHVQKKNTDAFFKARKHWKRVREKIYGKLITHKRRALSRLPLSGQLLRGANRSMPWPAPPLPSEVRYVPAACHAIRTKNGPGGQQGSAYIKHR
jgi:hypothetical protein